MSISTYLETAPLFELEKYRNAAHKDAVAFVGSPRKHPYEDDKLILILDPRLDTPVILEFRVSDIAAAEEQPSAVTKDGAGINLVKLWIRRGAFGVAHHPFEVGDTPRFGSEELRERMMRSFT